MAADGTAVETTIKTEAGVTVTAEGNTGTHTNTDGVPDSFTDGTVKLKVLLFQHLHLRALHIPPTPVGILMLLPQIILQMVS